MSGFNKRSNETKGAIRLFEKKNKAATTAFGKACEELDARIDGLFGEDQEWRHQQGGADYVSEQEGKVLRMLKGDVLNCGFAIPRGDQPAANLELYKFTLGIKMYSGDKAPRRTLAQIRANGLEYTGPTHAHLNVDEDIFVAACLAKMEAPTKADGRKSSASMALRQHTEALKAATKELQAILSFLRNVETYSTFLELKPEGVSARTGKPYDAFRSQERNESARALENILVNGEDVPQMSLKSKGRPDPTAHNARGPWFKKRPVNDADPMPTDTWMHNPATGSYERTQVVETPYVHEADEPRRDNREVREMMKRHRVDNDLAARILDARD